MVFACGISSYSVTMFHLMNHAFFKALLFLSAGSIIHAMHDEQDMRKMGALNRILPFTYTMTLIGSFALIGFPFLTGYYSKEFILEIASSKFEFSGNFAYWLGTISVSFTTFYSYRLLFLTFLNKTNAYKRLISNAHEANLILGSPLVFLAVASIFIGYLSKDMIIGLGSPFWGNSIFILSENLSFVEAEYLPYHIRAIPLIFSHLGLLFAYHTTQFFTFVPTRWSGLVANSKNAHPGDPSVDNLSASHSQTSGSQAVFSKILVLHEFFMRKPWIQMYTFFARCWNFDNLYNRFIVQKFIHFGYHTSFRLLDAGWIAYLGPYGLARVMSTAAKKLSLLQTGFVYHYAFIILVALSTLMLLLFSRDLLPGIFGEVYGLYFIFASTFFYLSFYKK